MGATVFAFLFLVSSVALVALEDLVVALLSVSDMSVEEVWWRGWLR